MSDNTLRKDGDDSDLEVSLSCARAVNEAFELSLRWLAVVTDEHQHIKDGETWKVVPSEPSVKRYGPFETHNDAELYASQITCCSETKIEVVEMHDIGVHNERMNRWHQEMDEKRKLKAAFALAAVPREGRE